MGFSSVKNMFQQRLPTLWTSWGMEAPEKWTGTSCSSWRLLQYIARDLKLVDGYVFGLLCQTISSTQVPEIKLKCLNILTASMDHLIADECDPATLRSLLQVFTLNKNDIQMKVAATSTFTFFCDHSLS